MQLVKGTRFQVPAPVVHEKKGAHQKLLEITAKRMHYLPALYVPCDIRKDKKYYRETLEVRFKGKNIAEMLDVTANEALVSNNSLNWLWRNKVN